MKAGKRRHRITLQAQGEVQDPATGDITIGWTDFAADVPASWLAGPGREYLAAESIRAEVAGRFELRWLDGVTAKMRVVSDGVIYNIKAPPITDPTQRRSMILLVGSGVNSG